MSFGSHRNQTLSTSGDRLSGATPTQQSMPPSSTRRQREREGGGGKGRRRDGPQISLIVAFISVFGPHRGDARHLSLVTRRQDRCKWTCTEKGKENPEAAFLPFAFYDLAASQREVFMKGVGTRSC